MKVSFSFLFGFDLLPLTLWRRLSFSFFLWHTDRAGSRLPLACSYDDDGGHGEPRCCVGVWVWSWTFFLRLTFCIVHHIHTRTVGLGFRIKEDCLNSWRVIHRCEFCSVEWYTCRRYQAMYENMTHHWRSLLQDLVMSWDLWIASLIPNLSFP